MRAQDGPPHLPIVGDFSNLRCSAISFLGETYSPPVSQPCIFGAIFIGVRGHVTLVTIDNFDGMAASGDGQISPDEISEALANPNFEMPQAGLCLGVGSRWVRGRIRLPREVRMGSKGDFLGSVGDNYKTPRNTNH